MANGGETTFADAFESELGTSVPEAAKDVTEEVGTAIAERPSSAVIVPPDGGNDVLTDDDDDLLLPRLKIAQKSSTFENLEDEDWNMGDLVLEGETVIPKSKLPIEFVVVAIDDHFMENVDFESEDVARRAKTVAQVREMAEPGATIDIFGDWLKVANLTLLVKQPEGVDDPSMFPFEVGGARWGLFNFLAARSGYRPVRSMIRTTERFTFRGDRQGGTYRLSTAKKKNAKNEWAVPVVKPGSVGISDDLKALLADFAAGE